MPKRYSVTPILRAGTTSYSATFRDFRGARVTRGLGISDRGAADVVCAMLVRLFGVRSAAEIPADVPVDSVAVRLYFAGSEGATFPARVMPEKRPTIALSEAELREMVERMGTQLEEGFIERAGLRMKLATETRRADEAEAKLQSLERSALGRAVRSAKEAKPLPEALVMFRAHLVANVSKKEVTDVMSIVDLFVASLPTERKTPYDIMPADIVRFLDQRAGDGGRKTARRNTARKRVSRFMNWAAREWDYVAQTKEVSGVSLLALSNERGDIHWHELTEVQAALKALPDDYWRTVVATLAFAGLQLAELAWLRKSDIQMDGDRASIWVTTVEDPEDGVRHKLKTGNRRRSVNIHPRHLLPLIREQLATRAGKTFLFPARLRTKSGRKSERWVLGTLSERLVGKEEVGKKKVGLLPKGMNARSLRRTFGSLLLRSGRSFVEVAAAMGNTPEIVKQHYARIAGKEVGVDF